jgi:hypothetical protein
MSDYSLEQGRPYIHKKCGQVTLITVGDFAGLCNPFQFVSGTVCASCGFPDSCSQFAWADTEELVSDYRSRLRQQAPSSLKVWNNVMSPLLGLVVGGFIGFLADPKNPATGSALGAGIGVLAMLLFIGPQITGALGANQFYQQP